MLFDVVDSFIMHNEYQIVFIPNTIANNINYRAILSILFLVPAQNYQNSPLSDKYKQEINIDIGKVGRLLFIQ